MNTVEELLGHKGRQVVTVSPEDSVLEAARRMNEHRIGAVVVVGADQTVVGMFTERDVLRYVAVSQGSQQTTRVDEVMSQPVTCCTLSTPLVECQQIMSGKRLRHLPVVEDERLIGIISSGDILAQQLAAQESTIAYMHEYLHGRR